MHTLPIKRIRLMYGKTIRGVFVSLITVEELKQYIDIIILLTNIEVIYAGNNTQSQAMFAKKDVNI